MKRDLTNKIRFVLDELIPPIIRDSRWFMWPFFVLAYRRFDVRSLMDFKQRAHHMSPQQYADFYAGLDQSVSRRRQTDLNEPCLRFIRQWLAGTHAVDLRTALDVGASRGYLLEQVHAVRPDLQLAGADASLPAHPSANYKSEIALLPNLPFDDQTFDLVLCTHVLEHVPKLDACVAELCRVARQVVLVVVPRQRHYNYTLDEHLNFFPQIEPLVALLGVHRTTVKLLGGDWLLLVDCSTQAGAQ